MKKLIVTLTLIATLCSANLSYAADRYVTLQKTTDGAAAITQAIAVDEVAFILVGLTTGNSDFDQKILITRNGHVYNVWSMLFREGAQAGDMTPIVVCGPCTISMVPYNVGAQTSRAMLTMKISPNPNIMGVKQ